jgi:uncharacterized protein (TIGR02099 family)
VKRFLRKLLKYTAYLGAAVVILLAVAVGLFRLLLPRLPEHQEQIKDWANAAVGLEVEFANMDARWRLSGPELTFYDAELATADGGSTLLHADEVSVGVGLLRLLLDLELVADRISIRDAELDVLQQPDGSWQVQGLSLDEFMRSRMVSGNDTGSLVVIGEDIDVQLELASRAGPLSVGIETLQFRRDAREQGIDASLVLPRALGTHLEVSASQRLTESVAAGPWRFFVEGRSLAMAGWSRLWPGRAPELASGMADIDLWLELEKGGLRSATANFLLEDAAVRQTADGGPGAATAAFSAEGRAEYLRDGDGWLVAADELVMTTMGNSWPQSSLSLQVRTGASGGVERINGRATYLNFDDLRHLQAFVPQPYRATLGDLALSGVARDLDVTIIEPASASRRFNGSAAMERAGVAAYRGWPGLRGFSGSLRADQSGGRLEIDAANLQFNQPEWFPEPVAIERAAGTVIWRHGDAGTTILSDSVRVRNADFDSMSSLQVTLPPDGESPLVDLHCRWSAGNVAVIERYLPVNVVTPALYRWLGDALVAGRVTQATTRLSGPLQAFPFDGGEGTFLTEAHVENAVLRYAGSWPAVDNITLDLIIDGTRLYSDENTATSLGNSVVDAQVEIPDLRSPVLRIDATATGTLDSILAFAQRSPIESLFGGQLDRVDVAGSASFDLLLTYPIRERQNYAFTTVIRSDNGTLQVDGMPAPVTDLRGAVTITRDAVSSEALVGRFLGAPMTIELARADEEMPTASVIARAQGSIAADNLIDGFNAPLGELLDGSTTFDATIRFPRPGLENPVPLQLAIESDLQGMALELPAPLGKPEGTVRPLSLDIAFPARGRIEMSGSLSDAVRWTTDFTRSDAGWDFDRGVVALGGARPDEPATRGLHVEGETPVLNFDDWLDLADAGSTGPGFGERIRSVDLVVDDLSVIGQRLSRHRVVVDRSAFDWVVQLDGEQIVGSITVPYDFDAGRPLELDMRKLTLPGGDGDRGAVEQRADPRTLPPLSVRADDFSLGNRHFGSLDAEFRRTNRGLETDSMETGSATFDIVGSAGWIIDEADSSGQRTFVNARLTSSNVQQTLEQLDYQPGIESEEMEVGFDVSWSGGPKQDFLDTLDGNVGVRLGAGQLNEVEPGAGRVFGLMSIVALPRRLSLDFSDVFERGFGFDEITGNFRLDDGQAYTCDLSLKGPAADVGIVGRTGLTNKVYEQAAVVSANVGNTLPVVGAVVAGPQVAAALLIFSQIFKKPLQEMGQIYYGIEGTWEDPAVDVVDASEFAAASEVAGCLENAGSAAQNQR